MRKRRKVGTRWLREGSIGRSALRCARRRPTCICILRLVTTPTPLVGPARLAHRRSAATTMASFLRRNKSSTTASSTASPKRPADQLQHAASSPGPPPQSAIPVAKSPRLSLRSRSSLRAALPMQTGAVVVADEGGPPIEQQQQQQSEGGEQRRKRRTSLKDLFRRSSSSGGGGGASAGPSSPSSSGRAPPSTPPSTGRSAPLDTISSRTSTNGSPLRAAADDSPAGSFRRKRVGYVASPLACETSSWSLARKESSGAFCCPSRLVSGFSMRRRDLMSVLLALCSRI